MSNLAYVEISTPLLKIAPRRLRSLQLGESVLVYSWFFNPHSLPLSVIPNISKSYELVPSHKVGQVVHHVQRRALVRH